MHHPDVVPISAQLTPLNIGIDPPLNHTGSSRQIDGLGLSFCVGDKETVGVNVSSLGLLEGRMEALLGLNDGTVV